MDSFLQLHEKIIFHQSSSWSSRKTEQWTILNKDKDAFLFIQTWPMYRQTDLAMYHNPKAKMFKFQVQESQLGP